MGDWSRGMPRSRCSCDLVFSGISAMLDILQIRDASWPILSNVNTAHTCAPTLSERARQVT